MSTVIRVENVSKQYRLGTIGTGTISHDLNRWWYKVRGKEDPYLKLGEVNDRTKVGDSDFVWVLNNINFEVEQGEVLGIIGKNGAGKSTLLKILSRTTSPTKGEIKIKGRVASLLEVGTGFHPELTGRENIFLNGAILGMTKNEIIKKFDEIVDFSGVERYIDTPVKRYSSGMYVRLAFAVAAHLEPEILIVDEVLAVGDAEFQKKCLGKMKDVSKEGRTVLFVSHNIGMIRSLCTRGLLLSQGNLELSGEVEDVIYRYSSSVKESTVKVALSEVKKRKGSGYVRAQEIWIEDKNQNICKELDAGEKYFFKINLRKIVKDFGIKVYVALVVRRLDGERIFTLTSDLKGQNFRIDSERVICFELEKMALSIGEFTIDVFVFTESEEIDVVENATSFMVVSNDYYGCGVQQSAGLDIFFNEFKVS